MFCRDGWINHDASLKLLKVIEDVESKPREKLQRYIEAHLKTFVVKAKADIM